MYYDQSLLDQYNGHHKKAKAYVLQGFLHSKALFMDPSIGRRTVLLLKDDITELSGNYQLDEETYDKGTSPTQRMQNELQEKRACDPHVAMHHVIAGDNRRSGDGLLGLARAGTACFESCRNVGISEKAAEFFTYVTTIVHEMGHNLGMRHTGSIATKPGDDHYG